MELLDSQVPAADVTLTARRIDEIVQPGVNVNPADTSYGEEVLKPPLRRRSTARSGCATAVAVRRAPIARR